MVVEKEKLKSEKLEIVNMVGLSKGQAKGKWYNKKFKSHALKITNIFKRMDLDQS